MMDGHLESLFEIAKLSVYCQEYIQVGRTGNNRGLDFVGLNFQGEWKNYSYPKTLKSHLDRWKRSIST